MAGTCWNGNKIEKLRSHYVFSTRKCRLYCRGTVTCARRIAKEHKIRNVEFRLGEIENLPIADNTADVCLSNCVINLSTNKPRVYREIFRALKPGGRISICDIIVVKELTKEILEDEAMYAC